MKVRVYELSRELELSHDETIALCRAAGAEVKNHLSAIWPEQADQVRSLAAQPAEASEPPEEEPTPADDDADTVIPCTDIGEDVAVDYAIAAGAQDAAEDALTSPVAAEQSDEPSWLGLLDGADSESASEAPAELAAAAPSADVAPQTPPASPQPVEPAQTWTAPGTASDAAPAPPAEPAPSVEHRARGAAHRGGLSATVTAAKRIPGRVYAVASVLIVMVLVALFVFVRPKNESMAAVREEISQREASLQMFDVEMTKLGSAEGQLTELETALAEFNNQLPKQGDIDVLLREVWTIADGAGLKTQRIKTLKPKQQGDYQVMPVELSLSGSFDGFYEFLLALENLPGTASVGTLRLLSVPRAEESPVDASLVLNVFCKPEGTN